MPQMDRGISRAAARLRSLRQRVRSEEGFSIVEVVISAAMIAFIAGGVLTGLDAAGRGAADLRHRSQADEIAHQDLERMRGMSAVQLANLNQTRTVTLDGTNFTITSTGQFLNSTSGGSSCTGNGTADYVKTVSSVTWATNRRQPVVEQTIITPPIGGTVQVRAVDQNNVGLSGVNATIDGPERLAATTDASGCAIFAGVGLGDYAVTASRAGYVDPDGNPSVTDQVTATSSDTSTVNLKPLGQAGAINASFRTRVNGTFYGSQLAPALSWFNSGMAAPKTQPAADLTLGSATVDTRTAPGFPLFPFTSGPSVYTNNYAIWAGNCVNDQPPNANMSYATVNPGATATPTVTLPALVLNVSYRTTLTTTRVTPSNIVIKDGCGQSWRPQVRRSPANPNSPLGQLDFPGQPYAANAPGRQLTVCVDYDPPGVTPPYKSNPNPTTANADFTNGTTPPVITIDSRSAANRGTCPFPLP